MAPGVGVTQLATEQDHLDKGEESSGHWQGLGSIPSCGGRFWKGPSCQDDLTPGKLVATGEECTQVPSPRLCSSVRPQPCVLRTLPFRGLWACLPLSYLLHSSPDLPHPALCPTTTLISAAASEPPGLTSLGSEAIMGQLGSKAEGRKASIQVVYRLQKSTPI